MKGCLILNPVSPRNSPRPPARKCVSFCGSGSNSSSSSDDEQEIVEVHVADDWDRTPCEITPKLTYQDLLELHELKNSTACSQYNSYLRPRPTQLLNRVPVGLLPLLSEPPSSPSKPPALPPTTTNGGSKNTGSINNTFSPSQPAFVRKSDSPAPWKPSSALASKFSFLPLMPVKEPSAGGQAVEMAQSPINPQSPATPANRLENRFQFLPLLPPETPPSDSVSGSEPPSDDDHASPVSTPSLTASSSLPSPPGTPSATSSPSLTASMATPDPDFSYFNLSRPPAGSDQKADQLRLTEVESNFSQLKLQALGGPNLIPQSPFDLGGGKSQPAGETGEKLDNSGRVGRKGGKRRIVEYININGVDEPFYSYVDDEDDEPPTLIKTDSVANLLAAPSNGFLRLYE